MNNSEKRIRKKAIITGIVIFLSVIGVLVVIKLANTRYGVGAVKDKGEISYNETDPYIWYNNESFFGPNPNTSQTLYDMTGKRVIDGNLRLDTGYPNSGNYLFVFDDKSGVVGFKQKEGSEIVDLPFPEDMKESNTILNFMGVSIDQKFRLYLGGNPNDFKIWVYNQEEQQWIEELVTKFSELEGFSKQMRTISSEIGWDNNRSIVALILRDYSDYSDPYNQGKVVAEYQYNPNTDELKTVKAIDPNLKSSYPEDIFGDDMHVVEAKDPGLFENILGAIFVVPFRLMAGGIGFKNQYYPENCDGSCGGLYETSLSNVQKDSRYVRLNNPVIGKQKMVLVDPTNKSERELMSWFATWNSNRISIQFAEGADKLLITANDKMGVYDLKTDGFKWIREVPYNPNGFDSDQIWPFQVSFF